MGKGEGGHLEEERATDCCYESGHLRQRWNVGAHCGDYARNATLITSLEQCEEGDIEEDATRVEIARKRVPVPWWEQ